MSKNVKVLKKNALDSVDETRLHCLTGPRRGEAFLLVGTRVVIGRSEKADIQIDDNKLSREHAELTLVKNDWILTDLNSQNGTIINDKKISQEKLKIKDKIIVGQTVLKFMLPNLNKKETSFKGVNNSEKILDKNFLENDDKKFTGTQLEKVAKKKGPSPILLIVIGLFIVFFLMDSDEDKSDEKSATKTTFDKIASSSPNLLKKSLPQSFEEDKADKKNKDKLDSIFRRGLRELREKNYYRAINEFNLALVIAPNNSQGDFYLRKAKEELDKEIEAFNLKALRDEEALKYKSAIISYCAIMRLLYTVPKDKRYQNAESRKKELELKLGLTKDETFCISK